MASRRARVVLARYLHRRSTVQGSGFRAMLANLAVPDGFDRNREHYQAMPFAEPVSDGFPEAYLPVRPMTDEQKAALALTMYKALLPKPEDAQAEHDRMFAEWSAGPRAADVPRPKVDLYARCRCGHARVFHADGLGCAGSHHDSVPCMSFNPEPKLFAHVHTDEPITQTIEYRGLRNGGAVMIGVYTDGCRVELTERAFAIFDEQFGVATCDTELPNEDDGTAPHLPRYDDGVTPRHPYDFRLPVFPYLGGREPRP